MYPVAGMNNFISSESVLLENSPGNSFLKKDLGIDYKSGINSEALN